MLAKHDLTHDTVLLVPNRRLCDYFKHDIAQSADSLVTQTPRVYTLEDWILECESSYAASHMQVFLHCLSSEEQFNCWQQIIAIDPSAHELLDIEQTTKAALTSYQRCCEYQLPIVAMQHAPQEETRRFWSWLNRYQQWLAKHHCRCPFERLSQLTNLHDFHSPTDKLYYYGFQTITPQLTAYFDFCEQQSIAVSQYLLPNTIVTSLQVIACKDAQHELSQAIQWAKQQPGQVALVVPDLMQQFLAVDRQMSALLMDNQMAFAINQSKPYTISSGIPLASTELISIALKFLRCLIGEIKTADLPGLINAPFIPGYLEEAAAREFLSAHILEEMSGEWTSQYLLLVKCRTIPQFKNHLKLFFAIKPYTKASILQWCEWCMQALTQLTWPGDLGQTSYTRQLVTRFYQIFDRLCQNSLLGQLTAKQMLDCLTRQCYQNLFQPSSEQARVHVLGIYEALGHPFDAMWVMGMNDTRWPEPVRIDPFIPVAMQHEHQLPFATVQKQWQFAVDAIDRFKQQCQTLVMSYPSFDQDVKLAPSPLITAESISAAILQPVLPLSDCADDGCEWYDDDWAPAIAGRVKGGTALLKQQAACPFQAFARFRLKSTPIVELATVNDAMTRGILLHAVLAYCWETIGDQKTLRKTSDQARQQLIDAAIDKVFSEYQKSFAIKEHPQLYQLEKQRIIRYVNLILECDAERSQSFTVTAIEQTDIVQIGPLQLQVALDRLDELETGEKIVWDYKTSVMSINQWLAERLQEPQLPLYCVTFPQPISAIGFIQCRQGQVRYYGLSHHDLECVGIKPLQEEWGAQVALWQTNLQALADAFAAGDAMVDPKDPSACRYCEQHRLCRINSFA